MLAGIGISIALGQLHVLLGAKAHAEPLQNLAALPRSIEDLNMWSTIIGLGTVALLMLWPRFPRHIRVIPGPLAVITLATLVAATLPADVAHPSLPTDILHLHIAPRLQGISATQFAAAALMMAALASVESLLSAVAVDKLHEGRRADLRRELYGQGVANMVTGVLGGLPVTGVIVRSSTNAMAGARSRASAILHGIWIILFVAFLAGAIEAVPMAALAGLLVFTGIRLVNVAHMKELALHKDLALYFTTIVGILLLGLVEGVALGMVLSFIMLPRR